MTTCTWKYYEYFPISAAKIVVHSRETVGDWLKFTAEVVDVYKQSSSTIRRGRTLLWLSRRDYTCRCPKLRLNRTYLISSKDSKAGERPGFTLNHRSRVTRWRASLTSTMMRYSQNYRYGACSNPRTPSRRNGRPYNSYY